MTAPARHTRMPIPLAIERRSLKIRAENRAMKTGLLATISAARPAVMVLRPRKKKTL